MGKISDLCRKYRGMIRYVFYGTGATIVNLAVYALFYYLFSIENLISTTVAWVASVAFAFVTNKIFVFESRSWKPKVALRECFDFVLCRAGSFAIEFFAMYFFVDHLKFNGMIMKFLTNIIVITLNYIASKLIIFRKSRLNPKGEE